ncbi:MAG: von Willebrand factor type A domain-containing protein, partial [Flavobacteriaceae bacterium]|nr:von Willebrand factor type A domain-containing protein [Flavobacteriaceae bacterium]
MKRVALLLAITFIACKTSTHETNQKKTNPETTETQSETKVSPKSESEVIKKIEPKEVLSIVEDEELVLPMSVEDEAHHVYNSVPVALSYRSQELGTHSNESYDRITENTFKHVATEPLSTFSIDVDKASYSNMRRMINGGETIRKDAIKIEELINYFDYSYQEPKNGHPFSIQADIGNTP